VPKQSIVLVAYASRHGSTKGIAERIGATLVEGGSRVDVRSCEDIHNVTKYDAVVFGSPVYDQVWIAEAFTFLRRNMTSLADRRTWLFSVGTFGDRHPLIGGLMAKEPKGVEEIIKAIGAREYRVFAGVSEAGRFSFIGRSMYRAFGGRWGDNRDWPEIDAWAHRISTELPGLKVV
jgi:menaquinone-dependent protoporphyrinogen oxidase